MKPIVRVAVIGGGASGMTAALCAAKGGAAVCIYEKNDRVGKKLLATGNGKCNFTNLLLEENSYNGGGKEQIHKILESFSPRDCIAYFESMGMLTKEKNGYLYPASEQASTVLDLLRMQLGFYGVCVKADCEIVRLCEENGEYRLFGYRDGKKESFSAEKVIIAAGSIAGIKNNGRSDPYGLLRTLKLPLVPVAPALVQLCCGEAYLKAVAGVRLQACISLCIDGKPVCRETGEVQLTDYGVSGIPVFQLSRFAAYGLLEKRKVQVHINSLPGFTDEAYKSFRKNRRIQNGEQSAEEYFLGICHKKLIQLWLKLSGIRPGEKAKDIPKEKMEAMFGYFRDFPLTVEKTNSFSQAQVCAGGLAMEAVDENLQLHRYPGVYVTGELLDVDGRCGGYNLQWAFASGYTAGTHAAAQQKKAGKGI